MNEHFQIQLHTLLVNSGAYALVEKVWQGKGPSIRYEFIDSEEFHGEARWAMFAPTIVLTANIIRKGLTNDRFLRVFLLHELGHIDHARRMYFGQAQRVEPTDIDTIEAEADDFVVAHGLKSDLIELLGRIEDTRIGNGLPVTVNTQRLRRLRATT